MHPRNRRSSAATLAALLSGLALLSACSTVSLDEPAPKATPPSPGTSAATAAAAPGAAEATAPTRAPSAPPATADNAPVKAAPSVLTEEDAVLPPREPTIRARLDPLDDAERLDLWQRIRSNYTITTLDNELVRSWEKYYQQRPDYVQRMTDRGSRYLFHIVEELERRKMPFDLALLPFVESAFNPQAQSVARASGMWQFMPATGRDFSLKQNLFRDDRRDVLASTNAALDFLARLHQRFGDWHLALAAYNWGPGNVSAAIRRNEARGKPTHYEALEMPSETRNYVPKLQAVKNIVMQPDAFNLALPKLENHPYFVTVQIERDIDVDLVARLSGLTLEQVQQLNPQLNKPVILAAGTPRVLLPYDNANRFVGELHRHRGQLATWTAWVAPKTLKPAEAARQVGMSEEELREVNRIPARMLVKAGSTLLVPRPSHHTRDVAERLADNASMELAPEPLPWRKQRYKVGRKGASVAELARRHGVPPAELARVNRVAESAQFRSGQVITLLVAQRHAAHAARSRAAEGDARSGSAAVASAKAKRDGKTSAAATAKAPNATRSAKADKAHHAPQGKAAKAAKTAKTAKASGAPSKAAPARTAATKGSKAPGRTASAKPPAPRAERSASASRARG